MRLTCTLKISPRAASLQMQTGLKYVRSTLLLRRQQCDPKNSSSSCDEHTYNLYIHCNSKSVSKYLVTRNVGRILVRFIGDGKCTIQFKNPAHDLYIQADSVPQLKVFLHAVKQAIDGLNNTLSDVSSIPKSDSIACLSENVACPSTRKTINSLSDFECIPACVRTVIAKSLNLVIIPKSVLNLAALNYLDLSGNRLAELPENLANMATLKDLRLGGNQLHASNWKWLDAPMAINIRTLYLNDNKLKRVPLTALLHLKNLSYLEFSGNRLEQLPFTVGAIQSLKELYLAGNQLTALPAEMRRLRLKYLDVSDNCFPTVCNAGALSEPQTYQPCSLLEWATRAIALHLLTDNTELLPWNLIRRMERLKRCICGNFLVDDCIRWIHPFDFKSITHTLKTSIRTIDNFLPMDCVFCSFHCYRSFTRARKPFR